MSDTVSPHSVKISAAKLWAFRVAALLLACIGMAVLGELFLRQSGKRISQSDRLAPGMVQYDSALGWKLNPGWKGSHTHHDFSATYEINTLGFRADTPVLSAEQMERLTVVVGDSFTFGLGVNDDATFVHLLQAERPTGVRFFNGAIPGYSTDQQALLLEGRLLALKPDRLMLVVYLGNDFFDNLKAFPMQVGSAKPYFVKGAAGLELRNSPVPMERKPRDLGGLSEAVWGPDASLWPWRTRLEQQSELVRLMFQATVPEKNREAEFTARFEAATQIFDGILDRIAADCAREKVELIVAVLAGRSFVEDAGSVSAQYQNVFREHIIAACARNRRRVIDVAGRMGEQHRRERASFFFLNDGHLNPLGHRVAANIIKAELTKLP